MKITLIQHLQAQNGWWSDPTRRLAANFEVRRAEFDAVRARLLDRTAPQVLLVGPRQVGKTVLLKQLADSILDEGWPPTGVVFFNLEDASWSRGAAPRLGEIVATHRKAFPELTDNQCIYLFDEVGQSARWAVALKQLHERRSGRFIATDSAVGLLTAQRETAGRYLEYPVPFLSFSDFVRFKSATPGVPADGALAVPNLGPQFDAYLERGGGPFQARMVDAAQARESIRERTRTSLFLDLARAAGLRQPDKAEALFAALAADSGTQFSAQARGEEDLGVPRQTVDRWLRTLVGTGLLSRLPRWAPGARARARAAPKVYAADPGIVAGFSVTAWPLEDAYSRGRIVETAAHRHLSAFAQRVDAGLSYFDDGSVEGDFVLRGRSLSLVVQVTAGRAPNPQDATKAARAAREVGKTGKALPVAASRHPFEVVHDLGDVRVKEVPLWVLCQRMESASSVEEVMEWLRP